LGLHAEILALVVPKYKMLEEELKIADDKIKNAIWVFLLSLLA